MEQLDLWDWAQSNVIRERLVRAREVLEEVEDALAGPYEPNHPRLFKDVREVIEDLQEFQ